MITIVDYGMGNLRSVSKALEHLGGSVKVSAAPSDIEKADKLVLPGVGAYGDAAKELNRLKLMDPLRESIEKKKPFWASALACSFFFRKAKNLRRVRVLGFLAEKFRDSGRTASKSLTWDGTGSKS